jgi:hypothetical protein
MIEILKPFGVGQYQSSIGFCPLPAARLGADRFGAGRFTARFAGLRFAAALLFFFAKRFAVRAIALSLAGFGMT